MVSPPHHAALGRLTSFSSPRETPTCYRGDWGALRYDVSSKGSANLPRRRVGVHGLVLST